MAFIAFALRRPAALLRMPKAIASGMSPTAFLRQLKSKGLGYRKQRVFADWRSVAQIEAKKDALKYVRKDRYPSLTDYAETEWPWQEEYAYKLKTLSRLKPDDPITERFVIIESDVPLTPGQMEEQVEERWVERALDYPEALEKVVGVTAYHRTPSPIE